MKRHHICYVAMVILGNALITRQMIPEFLCLYCKTHFKLIKMVLYVNVVGKSLMNGFFSSAAMRKKGNSRLKSTNSPVKAKACCTKPMTSSCFQQTKLF